MPNIDSQILSDRARAELAAKISQTGEGVNTVYVSLTTGEKPNDYVEATGLQIGSYPIAEGVVQRVKWNSGTSEWDDFGPAYVTVQGLKVSSLTDLKERAGVVDGQIIEFLEDGRAGTLYWDDSSTETANDATIIQVDGVTTGRWKRNYTKDYIYASWFGATPDSTDVYTELQAAIDFAEDNTIGKVLLEEGIYGLSETLKIPSYVYLIGSNSFRTKIRPVSGFTVTEPLIQIGPDTISDGGQACGLKDLRVEGTIIGDTTAINVLVSSKGMQENSGIFNCHLVSWREYGVYLTGNFVANTTLDDLHMFNLVDVGDSYIGIFLDEITWNGVYMYNVTVNGNPLGTNSDSTLPAVKVFRSRANIKNLHVENMECVAEIQNGGITGEHLSVNPTKVTNGVRILDHTGGEGGPTIIKNSYFFETENAIDDQFKGIKITRPYVDYYLSSRVTDGNNFNGVSFFDGTVKDNQNGFWDGCPIARANPSEIVTWEENFINFSIDENNKPIDWSYVVGGSSARIKSVNGFGGELQLETGSVLNDETYIQLGKTNEGASFRVKQESEQNLWFEALVELLTGNDDNVGVFVGLASSGNAITEFMADDTTTLRDTNLIGVSVNSSTPTQWDYVYKAETQTIQKILNVASSSAGNKVRFGFRFDGEDTVKFYINGEVINTITIDANFPNDVFLQPIIAVKTTNTTAKFIKCDYMKVVQNRSLSI